MNAHDSTLVDRLGLLQSVVKANLKHSYEDRFGEDLGPYAPLGKSKAGTRPLNSCQRVV